MPNWLLRILSERFSKESSKRPGCRSWGESYLPGEQTKCDRWDFKDLATCTLRVDERLLESKSLASHAFKKIVHEQQYIFHTVIASLTITAPFCNRRGSTRAVRPFNCITCSSSSNICKCQCTGGKIFPIIRRRWKKCESVLRFQVEISYRRLILNIADCLSLRSLNFSLAPVRQRVRERGGGETRTCPHRMFYGAQSLPQTDRNDRRVLCLPKD